MGRGPECRGECGVVVMPERYLTAMRRVNGGRVLLIEGPPATSASRGRPVGLDADGALEHGRIRP